MPRRNVEPLAGLVRNGDRSKLRSRRSNDIVVGHDQYRRYIDRPKRCLNRVEQHREGEVRPTAAGGVRES
jgi:hypothetical protein